MRNNAYLRLLRTLSTAYFALKWLNAGGICFIMFNTTVILAWLGCLWQLKMKYISLVRTFKTGINWFKNMIIGLLCYFK